jgi:hypothetical protein
MEKKLKPSSPQTKKRYLRLYRIKLAAQVASSIAMPQ